MRYEDRHGLYIGEGVALMSRAGIFRAKEGVAIEMNNQVYRLPSFNGMHQGLYFLCIGICDLCCGEVLQDTLAINFFVH